MNPLVISKNNLIKIVLVLTMFSSFYLVENQLISIFGALCAVCALFVCALMFIANMHKFCFDLTLTVFVLILVFFAIQLVCYWSFYALYPVAQIVSFMILIIVLEKTQFTPQKVNNCKHYVRILYYSILAIYFVAFLINEVIVLDENIVTVLDEIISSTFLKIVFPLSWFAIKRNLKTTPIEILIFMVFHFLLGERSAVLCMTAVLLFELILRRMSSRGSNILFWCVMIGALSMPFIYVWLFEQPIGTVINTYVKNLTGENFFSGRHRIWDVIIDGVSNNWLFGLGFGNTLLADHGINKSTHNLYMYLYLNGGVILTTLFIVFLYSIWKKIKYRTDSDSSVVVGKAYILGLFLFLDMELFLVANNTVISLVWWLTIAFIHVASRNDGIRYSEIK